VISTRDIKSKTRAVRNIEQICRAMKTVASIRLRRAEQRLTQARPYRRRIVDLARRLAAVSQDHPYVRGRPEGKVGLVVVTSDRGLCGAYNAGVIRRALAAAKPEKAVAIAVGRKSQAQMRRLGYEVVDRLVPLGGEPEAAEISALADRLGASYQAGELDRVVVVYAQFLGGTRSEVQAEVVLPVAARESPLAEAIFEPAPSEMLPGLMSRYLRTEVTAAVLEASTSEHAARVAAMTAATDNAEDMIRELTLQYNKARQAAITKELTEIVSAAEATA